jgi:hypothetical protein
MLSRRQYQRILHKLLQKHVPQKFMDRVMKDNQLYGELLTAIMESDWKFELDNHGHTTPYGFRRNGFKWKIGRIKREWCYHKKYKVCEYSNFDSIGTREYEANDINLYFEEFRRAITNSKNLKKSERICLIGKFMDMKPLEQIGPKCSKAKKRCLNRGIDKLEGGYGIFKLRRVSKHC